MKKYVIGLLIIILLLSISLGCTTKTKDIDPRKQELLEFLINAQYDEAIARARELYQGEDEELKNVIFWINNTKEKNKEIDKQSQELNKQLEEARLNLYPENKLEIQNDHTNKVKDDYIYITGSVKNISDTDVSYFEVIVKFLDNNDQVLDSNYTNDGLDLSPGEMREFEIRHKWNDKYKKYKLSIGKVK